MCFANVWPLSLSKNPVWPENNDYIAPATFVTPQKYSENARSAARTEKPTQDPSLIAILTSLLSDLISLFPKINSLITDFEFPVNFEVGDGPIPRMVNNDRGIYSSPTK